MINITNEGKYTISADILEQSKRAVVLVEDKNLRKKMYASMVAINTFIRQMKEKGLHLDTRESLTRVHSLIENIDLSNVVYRNLQLDIRVIINGNDIISRIRYVDSVILGHGNLNGVRISRRIGIFYWNDNSIPLNIRRSNITPPIHRNHLKRGVYYFGSYKEKL